MRKIIYAIQAGILLSGLAACEKKNYEPDTKDAVVQITVVDDKGTPQAGMPVLIFNEQGYERFQQDRKSEAQGFTLTLPNGQVSYRLPYREWFQSGNRVVTFVVMEEADEENYHIWAKSKTVQAAERLKVDFTLDRKPIGSGESGEEKDEGETGENGQSGNPDSPAEVGTMFEMFDEENGHTLFGNALFLDADHQFNGDHRYTIVDAGMVKSLQEMAPLTFERAAQRISAWPGRGYYICKDISLMEFPSGKWAMAIHAEYARIHVLEWLTRDGKNIGVKFNYTINKFSDEGLPEWDKVFEVKLSGDKSVNIPLPSQSHDSECVAWGEAPLLISFASDHVSIQVTDPQAAVGKEYRFVIRSQAAYSEAKLRIVE